MSWNLSRVVVENLGGILGRRSFEFKSTVNYIKGASAAGKTSLIRAIVWGLTGAWGLKGDYQVKMGHEADLSTLLNRGSKQGSVEITIDKKDKTLVIKREITRRGATCRLGRCELKIISDKSEEIIQGCQQVNDKLKSELEIPYLDLAYHIIFNGEHDLLLTVLPEGATLRNYLATCFGISRYEKAWSYLGEVERDLRREYEDYRDKAEERKEASVLLEDRQRLIEKLNSERTEKMRELNDIKSQLDSMSSQLRKLDELHNQITSLEKRINDKLSRLREIMFKIQARDEDSRKERSVIEKLNTQLQDVNQHLERNRRDLNNLVDNISNLEIECNSIRKELDELIGRRDHVEEELRLLKELRERKDRLTQLESEIRNLKSELSGMQRRYHECELELKMKNKNLSKKQAALLAIENVFSWIADSPSACPVCKRAWDEELRVRSIERLNPERRRYESEVRKLKENVNTLEKELAALDNEIRDINNRISRLEWEREHQKQELSELERKMTHRAIEELNEELISLKQEIRVKTERLKEIESNLADLNAQKVELEEEIRRLERDKVGIESEIAHSHRNLERYISEVSRLRLEQQAIEHEVSDLQQRLEVIRSGYDLERHQTLMNNYEQLIKDETRLRTEVTRIEKDLETYSREVEEIRDQALEYKMFKEKAVRYGDAVTLMEFVRGVIRGVAETLRDEIREIVSEDILNFLHALGFNRIERVEIDERYRIKVQLDDIELNLDTLCEGIRNAIGIGMKLSAAKFQNFIPRLICLDGCLRLDPSKIRALINLLVKMGVTNILITEREVTPRIRIASD